MQLDLMCSPKTCTLETGRWISEFEASLVYKDSSGTARAITQRDPETYYMI